MYAKPPFGDAAQVLDYLARYTHRVAIANSRLVEMTPETGTFQWRDYRHHDKRKYMTLTHEEFIRRLLLHVLPEGFQRIRHYGFLSNRQRPHQLPLCRRLLGVATTTVLSVVARLDYRTRYEQLTGQSLERCLACGQGRMKTVATFARISPTSLYRPQDTS